jgi:glycosyltransferase involved in cell wall biosynthesis
MKRVLYIQHAGALGGSAVSLRNMAIGVRSQGWDTVIALARPSPELTSYYRSYGFSPIAASDVVCWDHSTVAPRHLSNPRHILDLARVSRRWRLGKQATLQLIDSVKPDVVHLNSMPLSNAADALAEAGIPFVWHVREPPPDQGFRTRMIRRIMQRSPTCVFICEHDRREWLGPAGGQIVYNSVPDDWFMPQPHGAALPGDLQGLRPFLFAGGMATIKGADVLCDALQMLAAKRTDWVCRMPGAVAEPTPLTVRQALKRIAGWIGFRPMPERLLERFRSLGERVELLPFQKDMRPLMQQAEFVVFPAVVPHFARPIIEAAALGVPAIGSDVGGVRECIDDRATGLLCRPSDPGHLCLCIEQLLDAPDYRIALGRQAAIRARERYTVSQQMKAILGIYEECIAKRAPSCTNRPAADVGPSLANSAP